MRTDYEQNKHSPIPENISLKLRKELYDKLRETLWKDFTVIYTSELETSSPKSTIKADYTSTYENFANTTPLISIRIRYSNYKKITEFFKVEIDNLLKSILTEGGKNE